MSLLVTAPTVEKTSQSPKSTQLARIVVKTQLSIRLTITSVFMVTNTQIKIEICRDLVKTESVLTIVDKLSTGRRFTQKTTTTKITNITREN